MLKLQWIWCKWKQNDFTFESVYIKVEVKLINIKYKNLPASDKAAESSTNSAVQTILSVAVDTLITLRRLCSILIKNVCNSLSIFSTNSIKSHQITRYDYNALYIKDVFCADAVWRYLVNDLVVAAPPVKSICSFTRWWWRKWWRWCIRSTKKPSFLSV